MAGYSMWSMSNNAVEAYKSGEKPISKWTKTAILNAISDMGYDFPLLKKVKLVILRKYILENTAYHHTSIYYRKTQFYCPDSCILEKLTDDTILEWIAEGEALEKPKKPAPEKWECEFLEWSGTRNYPVAKEVIAVGEIRGNWFYLPNGKRKLTTARGFRMIRRIESSKEAD